MLISSFHARLEDLAEENAIEKSDAARELALESRKGSGGGSDNSKHAHEKTKDKKKNMEHRKTKDSKVRHFGQASSFIFLFFLCYCFACMVGSLYLKHSIYG